MACHLLLHVVTMATPTYLTRIALVAMAVLGAGCDEGEGMETIGPRGGVLTSPDGRVTLEIPEGALTEEVTLTIGELDDGPGGQIGYAYEILPKVVLTKPAELTFDLSPSGSADGARSLDLTDAGMELADVTIVGAKAHGWEDLPDLMEDDDSMTLSGSVLYTTTYAVVPRD